MIGFMTVMLKSGYFAQILKNFDYRIMVEKLIQNSIIIQLITITKKLHGYKYVYMIKYKLIIYRTQLNQ